MNDVNKVYQDIHNPTGKMGCIIFGVIFAIAPNIYNLFVLLKIIKQKLK